MPPRPFDSTSLHAAVQDALAALPDHQSNAFAVVATTQGLKGVFSQRINGRWKIQASGKYDYDGTVEGAVTITATW